MTDRAERNVAILLTREMFGQRVVDQVNDTGRDFGKGGDVTLDPVNELGARSRLTRTEAALDVPLLLP
jgi:hypothetical protein